MLGRQDLGLAVKIRGLAGKMPGLGGQECRAGAVHWKFMESQGAEISAWILRLKGKCRQGGWVRNSYSYLPGIALPGWEA